jgi:hypothetical protein
MRRLAGTRQAKGGQWGDFSEETAPSPPTYNANGPFAPQALTALPTAVAGTTIITAPFKASQKAIITYSVELDTTTTGVKNTAVLSIFDGTPATPIDGFSQTVGATGDGANAEQVVSWTTQVAGNGLSRTFGLAVSSAGALQVDTNSCRGVVQIVDG